MPEALQPAVSDMASPYTSSEKFKMLEKSPKIMSKIQSSPKYKSINPRSENPRQELIEPENYQQLNLKHESHIVSVSVLQKNAEYTAKYFFHPSVVRLFKCRSRLKSYDFMKLCKICFSYLSSARSGERDPIQQKREKAESALRLAWRAPTLKSLPSKINTK
jgi:hypothetical protein